MCLDYNLKELSGNAQTANLRFRSVLLKINFGLKGNGNLEIIFKTTYSRKYEKGEREIATAVQQIDWTSHVSFDRKSPILAT